MLRNVNMAEELDFSLITLNVRGLRDYRKRIKMCFKTGGKNSIYFLQETHCTKETETEWRQQWTGDSFFSFGTSQSAGLIIHVSPDLELSELKVLSDDNGRYILLYFMIKGINK